MILGKRIADARKIKNLSQAQLADALFISAQAVGKWERGESMPDILMFNRLAELLGVDLNYFSEKFPSVTREGLPPESNEKEKSTPEWDMSRGNWVDADFSGLKNLHEKFGASNMQRCRFVGSDLSGLLLKANEVEDCDFSNSRLGGSHFEASHMVRNNLANCALVEARFSGCHIRGCDFSGSDLTGVAFSRCDFSKNNIAGARWHRTSFEGVNVMDVTFDGILEDCSFENCAFSKVSFRNATLLNTFFKNRSLKRIRFENCRADRMTYEFLKNGKAGMSNIELIGLEQGA